MNATAKQVATYKTLARKIHPMWNDSRYLSDLESDRKFNEKIESIESTMAEIEELLSDEQREAIESWAYDNELFGVLGTC